MTEKMTHASFSGEVGHKNEETENFGVLANYSPQNQKIGHNFKDIFQHIKLLCPRELGEEEWIEIAQSEKAKKPNLALWMNKKKHLRKLTQLSERNLYVGNSLRIGNEQREGSKARAKENDCGDRFVWIIDVENVENHKESREQGKAVSKEEVMDYINIFRSRISSIHQHEPLYTAYTGGGGQIGYRLSRELTKEEQKPFGDDLKFVLKEHKASIEKDPKTQEIITPIGADPSRFDVSGTQRLIGSYNQDRGVQTCFFEINKDSAPLDVDKIFELAEQIKAEKDKVDLKSRIPASSSYGDWEGFTVELKSRIAISQTLCDLGWSGKNKGGRWAFHCGFHSPDKHPSFLVWDDIGSAHDYHNGEGYDVIKLVMKIKGCDFMTTVQWLADRVGMELPTGKTQEEPLTITSLQKDNDSDVSYVSYGLKDTEIIPMTPFPFEIVPQNLKGVIERLSSSLHVEPEMVGSIILAIISGAVGNTIRISPKSGYEVPPFIWLIVIAPSGYGKSPAINTLIKPINDLQADTYQDFQKKLAEYERTLKLAQKDPELELPDKPKLKHYHVSDITVEELANVFEGTPRGVVSHQDEVAGLILGLNQYKSKGKGNDRQHYLGLYDCESWKIDRKTGSLFIPNTGVAIIGGIQPKVMTKVFSDDAFDDGLLPRFVLLKVENKPQKFSRQGIGKDDTDYWKRLLSWCYGIPLSLRDNRFVEPKVLILSSEGLDLWETFYNEYAVITPYLSDKARVFIPKLLAYGLKFAGVLHVIKAFNNQRDDIPSIIDKETVSQAIQLTRFFAGQAIKVLDLYRPSEPALDEYQMKLIKSLSTLQSEVKNGKLPLSRVVEVLNSQLPDKFKQTSQKVSSLLKVLNLTTQKSTGNLSVLLWEEEKVEELFRKATITNVTNVTTVTSVTPNTKSPTSEEIKGLSKEQTSILEKVTPGNTIPVKENTHSDTCDCDSCINTPVHNKSILPLDLSAKEKMNASLEKIEEIISSTGTPIFKVQEIGGDGRPSIQMVPPESSNYEEVEHLYEGQCESERH